MGLCQKICCTELLKWRKKVYSSIKLHRIRGLKGMCRNKMKRNHVYDFAMYSLFWHIPYTPRILYSFLLKNVPLFCSNRQYIDTDTIDWYYQSGWLPMASIYCLKNFDFWLIVSIIGPKKFCSPLKSNHPLKIFFLLKTIDPRCFLQLIDYRYRFNQCFLAIGAQLWI
jgi:hypothetical protein